MNASEGYVGLCFSDYRPVSPMVRISSGITDFFGVAFRGIDGPPCLSIFCELVEQRFLLWNTPKVSYLIRLIQWFFRMAYFLSGYLTTGLILTNTGIYFRSLRAGMEA
jgi:hypothetical protein